MNIDMKKILQIVIKDKPIDLLQSDYKKMLSLFSFHHLENWLYYAAKKGVFSLTKEEWINLEKIHATAIYKALIQEEELKSISILFSENGIPFLPLKGSILRKWYPSSDLRSMADLDILIPKSDFKKVKSILPSLGYTLKHEGGNHDVYHKLPFMNIEIHQNMMDESYTLSSYYQDIWLKVKVKNQGSTELELTDEDFYLFVIAHGAKHFNNGGTGVRFLLDIYFILKQYPNLNRAYLTQELQKMGLIAFEEQMRKLANGWIDDTPLNEEDKTISDYIVRSGAYGTVQHAITSQLSIHDEILRFSQKKWAYLWKKAFPPYSVMKRAFPGLRFVPFLLPFFYGFRIVRAIFKGSVFLHTKNMKNIKKEDIENQQKIKEKVGRSV